MRNLRSPRSSSSSTFCFSSCRFPTINCPSTSTTTTSPCFLIEKLISLSPAGLPAFSRARSRRLEGGDRGHIDYVIGGRAAREIAARPRQPLDDGADGARVGQTLHELVPDVACVEGGEHEDVRLA